MPIEPKKLCIELLQFAYGIAVCTTTVYEIAHLLDPLEPKRLYSTDAVNVVHQAPLRMALTRLGTVAAWFATSTVRLDDCPGQQVLLQPEVAHQLVLAAPQERCRGTLCAKPCVIV